MLFDAPAGFFNGGAFVVFRFTFCQNFLGRCRRAARSFDLFALTLFFFFLDTADFSFFFGLFLGFQSGLFFVHTAFAFGFFRAAGFFLLVRFSNSLGYGLLALYIFSLR